MTDSMNELEALTGQAAAADADALPPVAPAAPVDENGQPLPPPLDYAAEAAGAVDFFAAMITGYCPKTESIWSQQTKARVSAAVAPVFAKYNFTLGNMPPEVTLLIVAGPPLYASAKLIAAQMQADKAEAAKEKPKAEAPGAPIDTSPPQEVHEQIKLYQ